MRPCTSLAFAALALAACSRDAPEPRHLVLVTVDTLRADALGCYGSPRPSTDAAHAAQRGSLPGFALDELAAQAVLFENAFTPRSMTFPALASLFTGLSPLEHGALSNGDLLPAAHETLAETLQQAGFFTAAFTTNKLLVPRSGIEQGFARFESDFSPARDENMARAAAACLREASGKGQRVFLWLHLVGPHLPYQPAALDGVDFEELCCDPAYRGAADGSRDFVDGAYSAQRTLAPGDVEQLRGLYAAEVARVDHVLSRFFAECAGAGLLDQSLLVFTADHGEELGERQGYFGHSKSVHAPGLRVPLFLRRPASLPAAARVPALVGLGDLYPTLLEELGLDARARPGRSFAALLGGGTLPERAQVGLWHERIFSVRDERWRLVWNPERVEPQETPPGPYPIPEFALYDERADPTDLVDLAARHPAEVARLRAEIERWRARLVPWSGGRVAPDAERARALKEMGYAGEKDGVPGEKH